MTRDDRGRSLNRRTRMAMLGGGCGGLSAAWPCDKTLTHAPDVEVTRMHQGPCCLFMPWQHEFAASDLDVTPLVNPIRHGSGAWSCLTAVVSTRVKDVRARPATTHETTRACLRHERGTPG
jgi:NADH dehydrogenase FAD-containing subunit